MLEIEAINKPYSKQSHKTSSSNSLPLSLSSTVKRFVRGFVQLAKKFKEIESNVSDTAHMHSTYYLIHYVILILYMHFIV